MAKKRGKKAVANNPRAGSNKRLSVGQLVEKQQQLTAQGKPRKAARVENRINRKVLRQPQSAAPVGELYAQRELQQNINTNRPDQYTIGGQQTYTVDPVTGKTTVSQNLAPEQQQLYDQQIAQVQAANQAFMSAFQSGIPYGQAYDLSGAPAAPNMQDLGAERSRIEGELYDRNMQQVNKTFDRQRGQLEQQLYNEGHMPGSPKFQQRMGELEQNFRDTEGQVRSQAVSQAGQEFERSFNLGTQGRQNYIGEQTFQRTQPMSELQALAGFGGGPTVQPQFFGFQPIQYQGPNYQEYLNMGIQNSLGQGALAIDRAALARQGGGGGGGPAPIPFSIGAAPSTIPPVPNYPNAAGSAFGQGFQGGVGLGAAFSGGQ